MALNRPVRWSARVAAPEASETPLCKARPRRLRRPLRVRHCRVACQDQRPLCREAAPQQTVRFRRPTPAVETDRVRVGSCAAARGTTALERKPDWMLTPARFVRQPSPARYSGERTPEQEQRSGGKIQPSRPRRGRLACPPPGFELTGDFVADLQLCSDALEKPPAERTVRLPQALLLAYALPSS